jgi:putative CocE/NonD family hydrolase
MSSTPPRPLPGFPGVRVERGVTHTVRDGTNLAADIYSPEGEGPFPVILIRLPYDKTQAENITYAHPAWYAKHGYIVVSEDTRGRGSSEGDWEPFRHEAEDGYDTIEWAAKLPGSNGKVGMYGFSYAGATQLLPATLRPPSLVAICPAMTGSQYYDGWTYQNGAFSLAFAASWALSLGDPNARRVKDDAGMTAYSAAFVNSMMWHWFLPLNEHIALKGGYTDYYFDWLAHPTYDDYWKQWSIDEDYSRITTPALHIAGWYDIFLSGTVKNFVSLQREAGTADAKAHQRLVIGPWFHIPWKPLVGVHSEDASPNLVDDWQLAWFDHHLKGIAERAHEPLVSIFVMREERWRDFDSWPPANAEPVSYYLHSGGRANSAFGDGELSIVPPAQEEADIFTYDPLIPPASQGGHSCCFDFVAPMGPADQAGREAANGVLVYTTAPLTDDLLLIGEPSLILHAASSAVDTDFAARLCVVDRDGVSTNIQEGIVRARYRDSLTAPTLIEPDRIYEYEIKLGPVGVKIAKGERVRVSVSSSDFPQWDRNMNTGGELGTEPASAAIVATQTVVHDAEHPSRLVLPVVTQP